MDPAQAARIIVDGVEHGRPRIRVGNDARAIDVLTRLAPSTYPRLSALLDHRLAAARR
jgi:hypothetical protein